MSEIYLFPRLSDFSKIKIIISKDVVFDNLNLSLLVDGKKKIDLKGRYSKKGNEVIVDLPQEIELGHSYFIVSPLYGKYPLNVNEAPSFEGFDEKYYFDGELGAIYSKEKTTFRLFAPLASKVLLKIKKTDTSYLFYDMKRLSSGVFEKEIEGDFDGATYLYEITNSELTTESIDPYAKGSTANGLASVVLDMESLKIEPSRHNLPKLENYVDAIIYEGNVRDLTIGRHTNIKNKGKYLGLIEENRVTDNNHPAGMDYFKMLGFTHIQLLPINDFKTVDELRSDKTYNWGYDPSQYFVPEGSYSNKPNDPKARIIEVQQMVQGFHKNGIRVVLDVVFNHVYEYLESSFEKTTPNFYFRKKKDGSMANTSWCGNDLASERPMVRKLIVDAAKWWISYYDIDGFRFDLMGIIDIETLKEIEEFAKKKDPSFMLYGEGWNMGGEVKIPLGNKENHQLIPSFAFFNDHYREATKNYVSGDKSSLDAFKYSIIGSCLEWSGKAPMFESFNQTINYVECHDNWTYHDYLENIKGQTSAQERLNRIKLSLAAIAFSFGIPFFHAGEEIGQSKFGVENSYNSGDAINKFSWALLDERFDMALYFKDLLKARKGMPIYRSSSIISNMKNIDFYDDEQCFFLKLNIEKNKQIIVIVNSTNKNMNYTFPADLRLLFTSGGLASTTNTTVKNVLVPKQSFLILADY